MVVFSLPFLSTSTLIHLSVTTIVWIGNLLSWLSPPISLHCCCCCCCLPLQSPSRTLIQSCFRILSVIQKVRYVSIITVSSLLSYLSVHLPVILTYQLTLSQGRSQSTYPAERLQAPHFSINPTLSVHKVSLGFRFGCTYLRSYATEGLYAYATLSIDSK